MFGERKRQNQKLVEKIEPPQGDLSFSMPGADAFIAVFLSAACMCGILALWFSMTVSMPIDTGFLYPSEAVASQGTETTKGEDGIATVGTPERFTVTEPNTVYWLNVVADGMKAQTWVWPEVELLDESGEYIASFGKELWRETGYDDGAWDEQDAELAVKFRIEEPGNYQLRLKAIASERPTGLKLKLQQLRGSSLPMSVAAIVFLLLALGANEIKRSFLWKLVSGEYGS